MQTQASQANAVHTLRSLSCSSHSMMKTMRFFFLFFVLKVILLSLTISKFIKKLLGSTKRQDMAKALQSFSSCSGHQFVMYFPWWYSNIPTGVGPLNEKASVHILLLGMYAWPQKMNPLHFFLFISCDRSSSEWKCPAFAQSSLPVYKQQP